MTEKFDPWPSAILTKAEEPAKNFSVGSVHVSLFNSSILRQPLKLFAFIILLAFTIMLNSNVNWREPMATAAAHPKYAFQSANAAGKLKSEARLAAISGAKALDQGMAAAGGAGLDGSIEVNSASEGSASNAIQPDSVAQKNCLPKEDIVFLKTHKCASSSVQNILLRYGLEHDKVFVLPTTNNYLGHPIRFNRSMVPQPDDTFSYNILCHHARLNYTEMRALMPSDTIFITIVRDPTELFESMYSYYKLDKFYKIRLVDLEEGSHNRSKEREMSERLNEKRYTDKMGPNQMLFDLGLDAKEFREYPYMISNYIKDLDEMFDLVLVAERMDESLLLLKQLLCWEFSDLVAFKVNARASKTTLSPYARQFIRSLNWADNKLYRYFLRKHINLVASYGHERLARDLAELHSETQKWYNYCVASARRARTNLISFQNKQLDNETCWMLTVKELPFTNFVRRRQLMRWPGSVFSHTVP